MESITSRKNEKLMHLRKLGNEKAYRSRWGEFVCDGEKLLRDAVTAGVVITGVYTSDSPPAFLPGDVPVYALKYDVLCSMSSLKTPQPVMFTCRMPEKNNSEQISGSSVIIENLQDPGNVGTILRTANAFNISQVITVGACADIYSPKTVRATMGAIFRQKIINTDLDGLKKMADNGLRIYGAALDKEAMELGKCDLRNAAVAIGSEGQGLTKELLDMCSGKVIIPMNGMCESLNAAVAAAVIMWEMRK